MVKLSANWAPAMQMQDVVQLSDRFLDPASPEGIDRQERLLSCIAMISVVYLVLSMAFVSLGALAKKEQAPFLAGRQINFELLVAPAALKEPTTVPVSNSGQSQSAVGFGAIWQSARRPPPAVHLVKRPLAPPVIPEPLGPAAKATGALLDLNNFLKPGRIESAPNLVSHAASSVVPLEGSPSISSATSNLHLPLSGAEEVGTGAALVNMTEGGPTPSSGSASSTPLSEAAGTGDIAPYRTALVKKVVANWVPGRQDESVTLTVKLARDGTVLEHRVLTASGRRAARAAIQAVQGTVFEALPSWFHGPNLTFKIELQSLTDL